MYALLDIKISPKFGMAINAGLINETNSVVK